MNGYGEAIEAENSIARLSALLRTVPSEPLRLLVNETQGEPAPESLYEHELQQVGGEAEYAGQASGFAILWALDAAPQFLDALDSVFSTMSARRHGPRPLIRSTVEHAARSAWLMDPMIDYRARGARAFLVEAVSADQLLTAMKRGGSEQARVDSRRRQQRVRERIAHLFGEGELRTPRSWNDWSLAGERFCSMTEVIDKLARRHFSSSTGRTFYMFQSALLHPSAASATVFSSRQDDGSLRFPDFDARFVKGSTWSALSAWQASVRDLLAYHGWESTEFEVWSTSLTGLAGELSLSNLDAEGEIDERGE